MEAKLFVCLFVGGGGYVFFFSHSSLPRKEVPDFYVPRLAGMFPLGCNKQSSGYLS